MARWLSVHFDMDCRGPNQVEEHRVEAGLLERAAHKCQVEDIRGTEVHIVRSMAEHRRLSLEQMAGRVEEHLEQAEARTR
jgi:hypothetical protein